MIPLGWYNLVCLRAQRPLSQAEKNICSRSEPGGFGPAGSLPKKHCNINMSCGGFGRSSCGGSSNLLLLVVCVQGGGGGGHKLERKCSGVAPQGSTRNAIYNFFRISEIFVRDLPFCIYMHPEKSLLFILLHIVCKREGGGCQDSM